MNIVRAGLSKLLREVADKLDTNTSEIEEEQALEIMKLVAHYPISKERAAIELHIHSSRFDTLIREGKIPIGYIIQQMHRVFKNMIGTGIK